MYVLVTSINMNTFLCIVCVKEYKYEKLHKGKVYIKTTKIDPS